MEQLYDGIRDWLYGLQDIEEFLEREEVQIRLLELNAEINTEKGEV